MPQETIDTFDNLGDLNTWFRGLSSDEKRLNGPAFNEARNKLKSRSQQPPSPLRSGHWERIAVIINLDSDMVTSGHFVPGYRDTWVSNQERSSK